MLFLYITLLGCLTLLYLWGNAACAAFRLGSRATLFWCVGSACFVWA